MKPDDRPQQLSPKAEVKTPQQKALATAHALPIKKPLEFMRRAGAVPVRIGTRLDIFA